MMQLDLFDPASSLAPSCTVGAGVRPWMDLSRPFHWRRNQLQREAERVGAAHIVYRRGEYGQSLVRSAEIRDTFYRQHSPELWPDTEYATEGA